MSTNWDRDTRTDIPRSPETSERIFPEIFPNQELDLEHIPSAESTHSKVTSYVLDYGNHIRQKHARNKQPKTNQRDRQDDLLRGMVPESDPGHFANPTSIEANMIQKPIKDLLKEALEPDKCNTEKFFLPRCKLEAVCGFDAVLGVLQPIFADNDRAERCANFICGSRERPSYDQKTSSREIFAILALIDHIHLISDIQENNIRDDDLPFRASEKKTKLWSRKADETNPLNFFQDFWTRFEFYTKQWWVHVPFIARDTDNRLALEYQLEPGTVMPWISISKDKERGGFGEVQEIEIHPDHHALGKHKSFALKTFFSENSDHNSASFNQEILAYRRVPAGNHHLVELCATFIVGDTYMLLFPWAEGGNLKMMWAENPTNLLGSASYSTSTLVQWIATQCHGLVHGLRSIHGVLADLNAENDNKSLYGIHGDIKPPNILHFSQDTRHHPFGCLKVADFGLLKFHRSDSRTEQTEAVAQAAHQAYRSPEHDITFIISRKVDIWALGCVFSELLTWVIQGPDALKEYEERRVDEQSHSGNFDGAKWNEDNFFVKHFEKRRMARIIEHFSKMDNATRLPIPRLKQSVKTWIDNLIQDAKSEDGATFLVDFLIFIKNKMLHPDRDERASCEDVEGFLSNCLSKGKSDSSYWDFQRRKVSQGQDNRRDAKSQDSFDTEIQRAGRSSFSKLVKKASRPRP